MANNFIVRESIPEDEKAILDLYNRYLGPKRTLDQWRWEFQGSLAAPPVQFVLCANGKIVGKMAILPIFLRSRGRLILSGRSQALVVDSQYRFLAARKRLSDKLIHTVVKASFDQGIELIWGYPMPHAVKTFQKAGFTMLGYVDAFTCDLSVLPYVQRGLTKAGLLSLRPVDAVLKRVGFRRLRLAGPVQMEGEQGYYVRSGASAAELAGIWDEVRDRYSLSIERNKSFLKWRFRDNPFFRNDFLVFEKCGLPVGFAVIGYRDQGWYRKSYLVDFVVDLDDREALLNCLELAKNYSKRMGAAQLVVWRLANETRDYSDCLRERGFSGPQPAALLKYITADRNKLADVVENQFNWYWTMASMEGTSF